MKEIISIVGATALGLYVWKEWRDSQTYGVPMFSQQLKQLQAQDAGF